MRKDLFKRQHIGSFPVEDATTISQIIREKIESGEPFAQRWFGTTEVSCLKAFEFDLERSVQSGSRYTMQNYSGFFPSTVEGAAFFIPDERSHEINDIQGIWFKNCEDYQR